MPDFPAIASAVTAIGGVCCTVRFGSELVPPFRSESSLPGGSAHHSYPAGATAWILPCGQTSADHAGLTTRSSERRLAVGAFCRFRVLRRQPPSLSLSPLGGTLDPTNANFHASGFWRFAVHACHGRVGSPIVTWSLEPDSVPERFRGGPCPSPAVHSAIQLCRDLLAGAFTERSTGPGITVAGGEFTLPRCPTSCRCRSPDRRPPLPNHALQRTEAGRRRGSEFRLDLASLCR